MRAQTFFVALHILQAFMIARFSHATAIETIRVVVVAALCRRVQRAHECGLLFLCNNVEASTSTARKRRGGPNLKFYVLSRRCCGTKLRRRDACAPPRTFIHARAHPLARFAHVYTTCVCVCVRTNVLYNVCVHVRVPTCVLVRTSTTTSSSTTTTDEIM